MDNTPQAPDLEGVKMKLPSQRPGSSPVGGQKSSGPVLVVLLLLLAGVLGGLYYWYYLGNKPIQSDPTGTRPTSQQNREPETPTAVAQVESMAVMSTSDELVTIEADLESTLLDSLEAELIQIEAELEASITTQ